MIRASVSNRNDDKKIAMTEDLTKQKPRLSAEQKIAQIKAYVQSLEAKEKGRKKAEDTRRKILLGEPQRLERSFLFPNAA